MRKRDSDFWEDVAKQIITFAIITAGIYLIDALAGKRVGILRRD